MHLPSSLSHLYYLDALFTNNIITKDWNIVIGKPFGADAYYYIWKKLGWIEKDKKYSYGIKHEELPFVNYSEETLGNALGVAAGIALSSNKRTWCNISDGTLQMGPTLEAIQFIGHHNLNIILTIDYNRIQLTGNTLDIMGITQTQIMDLFQNAGWLVFYIIDINPDALKQTIEKFTNRPIVFIFETIKGKGVREMEQDPVGWHYKNLKDLNEITISKELKDLGFFTSC
jgi:transketolase N-terminal domain/subunit